MEKDLIIRNANYDDVGTISKITKEAFQKYIQHAGIKGGLPALYETDDDIKKDIDEKIVLVVVLNNEVLGCVRVEVKDDNTAYLSRFAVCSNHHNLGLGKLLMAAVDDEMKKKGVRSIQLHTASKHTALIIFYYKFGFYIDEVTSDKGYLRASLKKDYINE